jgi:hypothetical protein
MLDQLGRLVHLELDAEDRVRTASRSRGRETAGSSPRTAETSAAQLH